MTSPSFTICPSCTPSHSSRPVPLEETDARRCATTRPVAFSIATDADGYAAATVANSTCWAALRLRTTSAAATSKYREPGPTSTSASTKGAAGASTAGAERSIASRASDGGAGGFGHEKEPGSDGSPC